MMYLRPFFNAAGQQIARISPGKTGRNPLRLFGFLVVLLFVNGRSRHEFHASVTKMEYNPKERTFEISMRVFTDDLEKTLSAASNSKVTLSDGTQPETDKNDPLLAQYVQTHFRFLTPQKQTKPVKYIGHEVEADANWLYLEMPFAEPFHGGLLKQDILMEAFDDQVNMVNIRYQGQKKTFVFRKNQPVQNISLE